MKTTLEQAPLSYIQERLWFIDTFEKNNLYEGGPVYHNLPLVIKLNGPVSAGTLQKAVDYLSLRHEILRCTLVEEGDVQDWVINEHLAPSFTITSIESLSAKAGAEGLSAALGKLLAVPFDLASNEALHRVELLSAGEACHYLVWTFHHLLADRSSLKVLFEELPLVYAALLDGQSPALPEPELQYIDFALWQKELPAEVQESLLLYWKHRLKAPIQALEIPLDHARVHVHIYEAATATASIGKELTARLEAIAADMGVSLRSLLYAAYETMLYRYSGLEEIVTGTPGNNHATHLGTAVGPADNLLVIRNFLDGQESFRSLCQKTAKLLDEAEAHQDMPFEQLSTLLNPAKDMSRTAFFDLLFQYEEQPEAKAAAGLHWDYVEHNSGLGKYDYNLLFSRHAEGMDLHLTYNKLYFEADSITDFCSNLCYLLSQLEAHTTTSLSRLPILSEARASELLHSMDISQVDFPRAANIISLFEQQVAAFPAREAVRFEEKAYTYAELDTFANRFARFLQTEKGVQSGDLVTVILDRSAEMIGVMMGILKAGACYIPVDPGYPQERIDFILEDSSSKAGIDQDTLDQFLASAESLPATAPEAEINPETLAYIIYTSGTTGKPKGVKVCHRNVVRLLFNEENLFDFNEQDVWTMFHSYCFDFSVWEMYGALLYGGLVIVIPRMVARDSAAFHTLLREQGVTILNQTPSAFYRLIEADTTAPSLENLRMVIFGGEALAPIKCGGWYKKYPATQLINMYGITETTVHVTYKLIGEEEISKNISSIGIPIPTLGAVLLDQHQNIVPRGVAGELYVFGDGVSKGYLNRPELSAQRFIELPILPGQTLYRSGDLARLLANGDMEYLGRIDNQVKIRGHRIELGELETNLLKHPELSHVVVSTRKDDQGDAYLVAYYISPSQLAPKALRNYIQELVPGYMVPSYFVPVDEIPLTSNGKADHKKLPDPTDLIEESETEYIAPRNATEETLAAIWAEILGRTQVSVTDNFFEIGGHSLKATQLISRIREQLGVSLKLSNIFAHPVLEELAGLLGAESKEEATAAVPRLADRSSFPLSAAQKRLWVLQQMEEASTTYNISNAFVLDMPIDAALMEQAVAALMERHEILRTRFVKEEGQEARQEVLPLEALSGYYQVTDLRDKQRGEADIAALMHEAAHQPFDLSAAPLLHMHLIRWTEEKTVIGYVMHHIISDGWSMQVFFGELTRLYHSLAAGKAAGMEALPFQYGDFAAWFADQVSSGSLQAQADYWQQQFAQPWSRIDLGAQKERPLVKTSRGAMNADFIDAELKAQLDSYCRQEGSTLFMGLHAVLNAFVHFYTGLEDTVIGVPVAGREGRGLENQIGFYVNTLALRSRFTKAASFRDLLRSTRAEDSKAFENQLYPFDQLVEDLQLRRDPSRSPIFDIMLVLQNTQDLRLSDTDAQVAAEPLSYQGESSKFDLTWFFTDTDEGLQLRMEYNTDLYTAATIAQLRADFGRVLQSLLSQPELALSAALPFGESPEIMQLHARSAATRKDEAGRFAEDSTERAGYEAPQGTAEEVLAAIWSELLKEEMPGRADDFFGLGGDSIKAIQLVSQLKKHDYALTVPQVMRYSVFSDMAAQMSKGHVQEEEQRVTGAVALSPIQQYFFEEVPTSTAHYNQSVVLSAKEALDVEALRTSLNALVEAHDMLRAVYPIEDGQRKQVIHDEAICSLEVIEFSECSFDDCRTQVQNHASYLQGSFDLEKGPLFKALLFRLRDHDRLLLVAHHLLVDGVSWRILISDFRECYAAAKAGIALPKLSRTHSYQRWVEQSMKVAASSQLKEQIALWSAEGEVIRTLPSRKTVKNNTENEVKQIAASMPAAQIKPLQQEAKTWLGADMQDLLIAALNSSIRSICPEGTLSITMESHGRDLLSHLDLSRTVGWFTAMFPLYLPAQSSDDLLASLLQTKEQVRACTSRGSYYGIARYLGGIEMPAQSTMCFNYLGQFDAGTEEEGSISLSTEAKGQERAGDQRRLFELEFTAAMVDGELHLNMKYHPEQYDTAQMEQLMQDWQKGLEAIATELSHSSQRFLTPSDVRATGLSLPAMLELQQIYKLENAYGLSPLQLSFFYHHLRYPEASSYFEQMRYRLAGAISEATFEQALRALNERHAVMHSIFREELGQQPVQVVLRDSEVEIHIEDLSSLNAADQEAYLDNYAQDDRERGFRLREELPVRYHLFRLAADRFEFIFSYHHIIMDGWCMPVIMQEFQQLYMGLAADQPAALPAPVPYEHYIDWLSEYPAAEGRRYWERLLQGYQSTTGNGISRQTGDLQDATRDLVYEECLLSGEAQEQLEGLIRQSKVTLNEVVQALWGIYLAQVNEQQDVVFGTVVSGRPSDLTGVDRMIGLFINTLPVRIRFEQEQTLSSLVQQLREQAIEGMPYHYTQLADLQAMHPTGKLFDHIMVFRNYPMGKPQESPWELEGLKAYEPNSFDFTIHVLPSPEKLAIRFVYHPGRYAAKDIQRIKEAFATLLSAYVAAPEQPIARLWSQLESLRKSFRKSGKQNRLSMLKKS